MQAGKKKTATKVVITLAKVAVQAKHLQVEIAGKIVEINASKLYINSASRSSSSHTNKMQTIFNWQLYTRKVIKATSKQDTQEKKRNAHEKVIISAAI